MEGQVPVCAERNASARWLEPAETPARAPAAGPNGTAEAPKVGEPVSEGAEPSRLARRLGLVDAVALGLGSMIGAGIFAAVGPAAAAAGSGLLIGLALAAVVAYANATSSAQLAAVYPEAGGTYVYGRETLGPLWGYLAGWGFVVGKTASLSAMALTVGAYAFPGYERPIGITAVVLLAAVNYVGVEKTANLTKVIVTVVIVALAFVVFATLAAPTMSPDNLTDLTSGGVSGILEAAGLLFFAFAGYARIATLGEEVVDPTRTIPRAIPLALGITVAIYAVVAVSALLAVGPDVLAQSTAPLATAAEGGLSWAVPLVRIGGTIAALGVLLSLLAGVSRTGFAMARNHELPAWLGAVHPVHQTPYRAELVAGAAIIAVVAVVDLRGAIGFSSFAVLTYYAIANASAFTQPESERRWPRWLQIVGITGCAVLALSLPVGSVIAGAVVLATGAAIWLARHRQN
jgi:basic amino acid/polyamine antiporter, APA family